MDLGCWLKIKQKENRLWARFKKNDSNRVNMTQNRFQSLSDMGQQNGHDRGKRKFRKEPQSNNNQNIPISSGTRQFYNFDPSSSKSTIVVNVSSFTQVPRKQVNHTVRDDTTSPLAKATSEHIQINKKATIQTPRDTQLVSMGVVTGLCVEQNHFLSTHQNNHATNQATKPSST